MRLLIRHGDVLQFWCPGCKEGHPFHLSGSVVWQWNGSMESPTFTPSLIVNRGTPRQCHVIITSGIINFCADCAHELRGQQVRMTDWDTVIGEEKMEENAQAPAPEEALDAATDSAKDPEAKNEGEIKEKEGPPEPGMKRCRSC